VAFTTVPGALTNSATESLVASASDATTSVASVDFRYAATAGGCPTGTLIANATSAPYTAAPPWTAPSDGSFVVCAIATDLVGNTSTPATSAVTVDRTAPAVSLAAFGTIVGPDTYVAGSPALHATASDATSGVANVDFSFAGATSGTIDHLPGSGTPGTTDPYDTTWPTGALPDGTYTVTASATDAATNSGAPPAGRTVIVDNTPPVASLDDPGAFGYGTISLSISASDGGSGVDTPGIVVQSSPHGAGTWTTIGAPASWMPPNGSYDLRAIVHDNVGNSTTTATRTILIDNTPPTLSDDADSNWHRNAVSVTLTATDAESGVLPADVQHSVDAGPFTAGTSVVVPAPADGSNDGAHTITWRATNRAGVQSPADKVATVKIDASAPNNVTLDEPAVAAQLRGTILGPGLTATAQDAVSGIASTSLRIAAAGTLGANPCDTFGTAVSAPFDTTAFVDGHYDMWVAAVDNAGNLACSAVPHDVVIDNTAPVTTDNAPGGAQNHDVTVTLVPTDNLTGVSATEYSLDNGSSWSPGTSVTILASGGDGTKTITYRSIDGAGNLEASKSTQVTIDTTAPAGNPNDPGNVLHGTVDLTASPAAPDVASVEFLYRLVGSLGAYTPIGTDTTAPYDVPWFTNGIADGDYDVEEIVTDTVGNSSTALLSAKTIDNTAPDSGSVISPAAGADLNGTISFGAVAHDAGSGVAAVAFQVKPFGAGGFSTVDADTSGPAYSGSWSSVGSPDGPAQVRVAVTDVAGNGPLFSAPVTFTVDNTAPSVTVSSPADAAGSVAIGATGSADIESVDFAYSPHGANTWTTIGTATTSPFGVTWPTGALADGLYDVRASATDGGGNTSADLATVQVDNTVPTGNLTAPAAAGTVGGTSVALTAGGVADAGGSGIAGVSFEIAPVRVARSRPRQRSRRRRSTATGM
jgi:hypothetical protein